MPKLSEFLHSEIVRLSENLKCSIFEAASEYCIRNDVDPDELVKNLDSQAIKRIQKSAVEARAIQKKKSHSFFPTVDLTLFESTTSLLKTEGLE